MFTYIYVFFLKDFSFKIHFYTPIELAELIQEGKSIIRLGDGEINLFHGFKNHYHFFSPSLKDMIKKIITSYSSESLYILSVPRFINVSNQELKMIGKLSVWLPLKVVFLLLFPKKISYMDSHNFYYDEYFENFLTPLFVNKKIIFVTNGKTIKKQKQNTKLPWKDIVYIETPETDALISYDNIVTLINKEIKKHNSKDVVLFIAMGPVGKYLIYEYADRGYQGIDIGKIAEVMFTGESVQYLI
ncbi:MAG: GT-D fold domain-containing glycosyltransferase [bacterium]